MERKRLKVLISAFACQPNKGSEPEVGWQWAMQMSLYHDVTVLTRIYHRAVIERALEPFRGKRPLPQFVYHEEGPLLCWLFERYNIIRIYYVFWQLSAWKVISKLNRETSFDLMHHVTIAGFRFNTAIWNHGVATIWGPVGGILSIPWRLLPWKHPKPLLFELFRSINNFLQSFPFNFLPKRVQMTTITLVSTKEMQKVFQALGLEARLMPTIGLNTRLLPEPASRSHKGPLKMLFAGSIITLKGIDLAIQAVAEAGTDATFTIIGNGPFMDSARKLVRQLGIESKVEFRGRLPLSEVLRSYGDYDLFLFPSLHDTGSFAVIEAMTCGLPVICVDSGGPSIAVKEGSGVKVPVGSRKEVVTGLAEAIRLYDRDRELLLEHGRAAREVVLREYDWENKGRELDEVYRQAMVEWKDSQSGVRLPSKTERKELLPRMVSIRSLVFTAIILFLIGSAGFLSVEHLRKNAQLIVEDTLPGLSDAGAANSARAEAFNRTLLLLTARAPEEHEAERKELELFSRQTSASLSFFERTNLTSAESNLFKQVMERRQKYQAARQEVLKLVEQQQQAQAVQAGKNSMLPAYLEYKAEAEKFLKYNASVGKARGEAILQTCAITGYVVVGIGVVLFTAGFIIGLLK